MNFKIGETVEVRFIGEIVNISLINDKVLYEVEDKNTYARRLDKSQIFPLPIPEDFEK